MSTLVASVAERNRQKRQLAEQAVRLAMQNQWAEAVEVNRQIIDLVPEEVDAWNRLGKALSELEHYRDAHDAYSQALQRDPNNTIAQKQVKRLSLLVEAQPEAEVKTSKLDPKLLIEETGKTGIFELERPAAPEVLARLTAGNQVYLREQGKMLVVENHRGVRIGDVPAKAGTRLIELMHGGNEYLAGVTSVSERTVRVLIREMRQSMQNEGRVSFPSKGAPQLAETRAYKERALRFAFEEEELFDESEDEEEVEVEVEEAEVEAEPDVEETTSDIEYYPDSGSASL